MIAHDPARDDACPVCRAPGSEWFLSVDGRDYRRCGTCAARFLDRSQLPSRDAEEAQYRLHENNLHDAGYRRFLAKLADPLLERLPPASRGLDYGCGPGPALAAMLHEAGHAVALYDPLFHPDPAPLAQLHDFVTCTETAEHFHCPADEFARLMALVRPEGWLAIMTCFQTDDARFRDWRYRMDPTHVVFYREETLRHLARAAGWSFETPCKDVALMQAPVSSTRTTR